MQLDLEKGNGLVIQSFRLGEIRINDAIITNNIIITADEILGEWSPPPIAEIGIVDFELPLEQGPEVILFGTGMTQQFPAGILTTDILRRGIGFEVMDTGAACRTFNVLRSEQRRVVAALLLS
jgi:uncharacterized protein